MKNSIEELKGVLTKDQKLSNENLFAVKGGCGTVTDPRRCDEFVARWLERLKNWAN